MNKEEKFKEKVKDPLDEIFVKEHSISFYKKRIKSLEEDKKEYESYHKILSFEIKRLKQFIREQLTVLSPKEALDKLKKKNKLIQNNLISFDRNNKRAVINYARDFGYEEEIKKALELQEKEFLKKSKQMKCDVCKKEHDESLMSKECPDCYLQGFQNELKKQKEEFIQIIDELYKKYTEFDSMDSNLECDTNYATRQDYSFTKETGNDNCWWLNLDDLRDIIKELKDKLKSPKVKMTAKGFMEDIKKSSLYGKKFDTKEELKECKYLFGDWCRHPKFVNSTQQKCWCEYENYKCNGMEEATLESPNTHLKEKTDNGC